jgi:hypothetical protein
METSLKEWCREELSNQLGYAVDNDIIEYIVSMTSKHDVEDYLQSSFQNKTNPEFLREFLLRWESMVDLRHSQGDSEVMVAHRKPAQEELTLFENKKYKKNKKKKPISDETGASMKSHQNTAIHKQPLPSAAIPYDNFKHVQLKETMVGRHDCQCMGQKHKLINNCIECGRIICEQEGAGPCSFCGNVVLTKEEEKSMNKKKKPNNYQKNNKSTARDDSTSHRDKLLMSDRTESHRNRVIDDQSDHFTSDSRWIDPKEREVLKKEEEELMAMKYSRNKTYTFDFAGRSVIEESVPTKDKVETKSPEKIPQSAMKSMLNPVIPVSTPPKYLIKKGKPIGVSGHSRNNEMILSNRLQDMSLRDGGLCLSLHQPWASLLVCGIKRHEGRTWYTNHRGILWIASTAKTPSHEDIEDMRQFYANYYGG